MDDKKSVTIRMGVGDIQIMEDYLESHPEFENQSHLIRTALKNYMNRDARVSSSNETVSEKGGVFIRLTETESAALRVIMKRESFLAEEEFIRFWLRKAISPTENGPYADAYVVARDVQL